MSAPKSPTPALDALNPKQRAFVRAFIVKRAIREAAIDAGYKPSSAHNQGHRMMQREDVQAAIAEQEQLAQQRTEITLDRILEELGRIAFTGLGKFVRITPDGDPMIDMSKCTPEDIDLLSEITVDDYTEGRGEDTRAVRKIKIKPLERMRALELLGKHLGMGNKAEEERADGFQRALLDIVARGSSMPIGRKP